MRRLRRTRSRLRRWWRYKVLRRPQKVHDWLADVEKAKQRFAEACDGVTLQAWQEAISRHER